MLMISLRNVSKPLYQWPTNAHPYHICRRGFSDHLRVPTPDGKGAMRIPITSPKVIGTCISRGSREYQEDAHAIAAIKLNPSILRRTAERVEKGHHWDPAADDDFAFNVLFAGIYDGHGGNTVSHYLQEHLHEVFETVDPKGVPSIVQTIKGYGGYFRRFRGGALEPWAQNGWDHVDEHTEMNLTLEAYATLAFLQADINIAQLPESSECGATASVALIHSLDMPESPFYSAEWLSITVAHCGDTRGLLCKTDGKVIPMTANHHADERGESSRLRRVGGGMVMDSFGDARWMGKLANTRCLGDIQYRQFGVTPEPEVHTRVVRGDTVSSMVLVSDGISGILSDDEISDLVRSKSRQGPAACAKEVLEFAEELGTDDNCTVVVIPLPGWSTNVKDFTKELREYRRSGAAMSGRQRRM
ncbi:hypothetical protein FRC14_006251 [Serendipita sp. 396]|nr:hypothetical protein FRC14_006251 [Serendipita sp. 396]KAG8878091.1 hypothetical protein FRC20_009376 [Serendipita sp. 405]